MAQLERLMENIVEHFGDHCLPINLPSADGESVVDCYFEPELGPEQLQQLGLTTKQIQAWASTDKEVDACLSFANAVS